MNLAQIIKSRRLELGLTMKEIADRAGVAEATVSRWESGEIGSMKLSIAAKVANALHISPLMFFGEEITQEKVFKIPLVEKIYSNSLLMTGENIREEVDVDVGLEGNVSFAWTVPDDSMAPQITKGDCVLIRKQEEVSDGDVALFLLEQKFPLIRRISKRANGIMLICFNQIGEFQTEFYSNEDIIKLPVLTIGRIVRSIHNW